MAEGELVDLLTPMFSGDSTAARNGIRQVLAMSDQEAEDCLVRWYGNEMLELARRGPDG
jgi:cell division protein FtsX